MMDPESPTFETSSWNEQLQTLCQLVQCDAKGKCLLWVNPAQSDPFRADSLVQSRKISVPIVHPRFDSKFAPYLVPLNLAENRDTDVFALSVQLAWESWRLERLQAFRGQPIAGWVMTDATPRSVAHHWATYSHIHRDKGLVKLLRFHDPSVREWLWPTLNKTQQQQLIGPATCLIGINRQQQLMIHSAHRTDDATPESLRSIPQIRKLNLTPRQWSQVDDYGITHAAWVKWHGMHEDCGTASIQSADWQEQVFDALRHARDYGIHASQDRELFAMHALQLGAQFHLHPKMTSVWERTRTGEDYAFVLEEAFEPNTILSLDLQSAQ
jgi:hypothetical protein